MKYVIATDSRTGFFFPVVFSDDLVHAQVAKGAFPTGVTPSSAGFVHLRGKVALAYGKSDSLKLSAKVKEDSLVLTMFLTQGLSGLALSNLLLLAEFGK